MFGRVRNNATTPFSYVHLTVKVIDLRPGAFRSFEAFKTWPRAVRLTTDKEGPRGSLAMASMEARSVG